MIAWTPTAAGRYESERFTVFAENDRWIAVDTLLFESSPGFHLPDAARAWCEARIQTGVPYDERADGRRSG